MCHGGHVTETGLREAKRNATAHSLAQAAFDLARECGLDGFTIDDVAARAWCQLDSAAGTLVNR